VSPERVPRFGIVTGEQAPQLTADGQALKSELQERGYAAEPVVWTEPHVSWATFDAVLVRSCWQYYRRPAAFRELLTVWTRQVLRSSTSCPFRNQVRRLTSGRTSRHRNWTWTTRAWREPTPSTDGNGRSTFQRPRGTDKELSTPGARHHPLQQSVSTLHVCTSTVSNALYRNRSSGNFPKLSGYRTLWGG